MISFVTLLDYLGTFAFAISGIRLASMKRFDWFGAYVVGLVTAIGGGTIRDLLLDATPFWMIQPSYIIWTGIALLFVILFSKYLIRLSNTFFIFDTIGLALFVVVGFEKTLSFGFPYWVAVLMGTATGAAGGVIRDILINVEPLVFRKEIYAMACVLGGVVYALFDHLGFDTTFTQTAAAIGVMVTRILSVKYHICLPVLSGEEHHHEKHSSEKK
ncbi:MAG: trimeric intracellular cation channel family protein [Bacteroidales bacterium]